VLDRAIQEEFSDVWNRGRQIHANRERFIDVYCTLFTVFRVDNQYIVLALGNNHTWNTYLCFIRTPYPLLWTILL
jgi:hypothetical protein